MSASAEQFGLKGVSIVKPVRQPNVAKDTEMPRRPLQDEDTEDRIDRMERMLERIEGKVETQPNGRWVDRWVPFLGGLMIVGVGWVANGIYVARGTEGELREKLAVLTEKMTQTEARAIEERAEFRRNYLLLDERYRQLSIALEVKGVRLPTK